MKSVLMFVLFLTLVSLGARAAEVAPGPEATTETTTQCMYDPIPSGWVATDQFNDMGQCNTPYPPTLLQANVLRITRYNNLLLGSTLKVCSADYTAVTGWSAGPWHYEAGICGCPYPGGCTPFANNAYTITHMTCEAGQSNCYQASVTASPAQVIVPYGQTYGTGNATWRSPTNASVYIWVKSTYGSTVQTALWTSGVARSNVPWNWVRVGGTTQFLMSASNTSSTPTLATSNVISGVQGAQPTFSISPSHVIVPIGQSSGPFSFTWNAPGYSSLDLWGKINTDPWHYGLVIGGSGNSGDNIPVGSTYTYRFYVLGSPGPLSTQPNQGLLGELTTYASH